MNPARNDVPLDTAEPTSGAASPGARLRGDLGVVQLIFAVLAFNGPLAAVVGFSPVVVGFGNGLGAPVSYLLAAAVIALFTVGFTSMARSVENPGGFYSYVTAGLGRAVGLGASFLAIVSYLLLLLGAYAFTGLVTGSLVAGLLHGPDLPWWVWGLVVMALSAVLGYFRLDVSARVLTASLAAEALLILVYDAVVVTRGGAHGLTTSSFVPSHIFSGSIGLGLLFAMFCMAGFEVTAIFRDEVRDPERTVPRAAYGFVLMVGTVYGLTTWALIQALGDERAVALSAADPTGAFLSTVRTYLGTVGVDLVNILLCTSLVAATLATHNVLSRYLFNVAADGVLPTRLAAVHDRHGSPHVASLVTTVISLAGVTVLILAGAAPGLLYAQLMGGFGYGFLLLLLVTSVAIVAHLRRTRPPGTTVWNQLVAPSLAFAGVAVTLYLATDNLDLLITGGGGVVGGLLGALYGSLTLGVVVALAFRRRRPDVYARIGRQ